MYRAANSRPYNIIGRLYNKLKFVHRHKQTPEQLKLLRGYLIH